MRLGSALFDDDEYRLIWQCLGDPDAYGLTAPEVRACEAVLRHCEDGAAITDEDARLARALLETIVRDETQ